MKKQFKLITILCSTAALFLIAGNAISKNHHGLKFDLVPSDRAKVVNVSVLEKGSIIKIRGKLRNKRIGRNVPIPGKVEISVIAADGSVLSTHSTAVRKIKSLAPHRRYANSRYAYFQHEFKETPVAGSTIRIKHLQ